jgi:hypothetical protein
MTATGHLTNSHTLRGGHLNTFTTAVRLVVAPWVKVSLHAAMQGVPESCL